MRGAIGAVAGLALGPQLASASGCGPLCELPWVRGVIGPTDILIESPGGIVKEWLVFPCPSLGLTVEEVVANLREFYPEATIFTPVFEPMDTTYHGPNNRPDAADGMSGPPRIPSPDEIV